MNSQCLCASTTLLLNSTGNGHIQEGHKGLMGSDDRVCLEYLLVIITGITFHRQIASPQSESSGSSLLLSARTNGTNIPHRPPLVETAIDLISAPSFH